MSSSFCAITPGSFPDWVVVSVGDGCTIGGVWKGLTEMHLLGLLPRLPRILGVQAEGCKPFVTAWRDQRPLAPCDANTLADSIAVGHPRNFAKGMRAVTESGGAFVSVSDEDILESIPMLARKAGVFGEPAGVAGVAGIRKARSNSASSVRSETVALIMTGNGLKDIQSAIRAAGRPISVRPEMEEVRAAVDCRSRQPQDSHGTREERERRQRWQIFPSARTYDEMLDPGLARQGRSRKSAGRT